MHLPIPVHEVQYQGVSAHARPQGAGGDCESERRGTCIHEMHISLKNIYNIPDITSCDKCKVL